MGDSPQRRFGHYHAHQLLVSQAAVLCVLFLTESSFCITDVEALVNSDSDFAIIEVIRNTTGSTAATIVLGSILMVLLFFSTVTTVASASRQIWAFSRDQVSNVLSRAVL